MVIRRRHPALVVSQPAHAWLAGQIGRVWGNHQFGRPPLYDELLFAADQHDLGYLDWELAPTVDVETGWPHDYKTLPCSPHLGLWRTGIDRLLPVSRFGALMISLHSAGLYRKHFDWETAGKAEQRRVKSYLDEQEAFQRRLIDDLSQSKRYAQLKDPDQLRIYSFLMGAWDLMSLHLCEASGGELRIDEVPTVHGPSVVRVIPTGNVVEGFRVDPWPFSMSQIVLRYEARSISPPYESNEALRQDLAQRRGFQVETRLVPADSSTSGQGNR